MAVGAVNTVGAIDAINDAGAVGDIVAIGLRVRGAEIITNMGRHEGQSQKTDLEDSVEEGHLDCARLWGKHNGGS